MSLILLVGLSGEVAGIGIQGLEQAVQGAIGHLGNVGLFDVLAAHARQNLAVNLQLAVSAVVRRGVHASHGPDYNKQQDGE